MNRHNLDILNILMTSPFINQRILAEQSGYSLGIVNRSMKELLNKEYIDENARPTIKAINRTKYSSPQRAVILAAGFGMRMVPINMEMPKGLIEINEEPLIERLISQLHDVGIREIKVVVGFMKEQYEYLIDDFGVELVVNRDYASKNNLHSLYLAREWIENAYIIPCDIWCDSNPFNKYELYSWYMVSEELDEDSSVRVNRKMELVETSKGLCGNKMIGISYISKDDAENLTKKIEKLNGDKKYDNAFWEAALYIKDRMFISAKVVSSGKVTEINTYEQLRDIDNNSNNLKNDAIDIICDTLQIESSDIKDIDVLKKGMTNRSFMFTCNDKKYIMRIPGEGTDKLINRCQEAEVYSTISEKNICDEIAYINPQNGYKITEFLEGARVCNSENISDVKKCMKKLRELHYLNLKVNHEFDVFKQIEFYESLWDGHPSIYKDYNKTKANVFSLGSYVDKHIENKVLTHIDAVPDNFLFVEIDGKEEIRLIDWEYAGMQDPHLDIAMFSIYAMYNREQVDELIDIYFEGKCNHATRVKIYCYISMSGLLWSNWCEYKRNLGVEFGEYSLCQYRYAKDYYKIVQEELKNES